MLKNSLKILISWRFLLNIAVILVVTCWVPLVSQTMVVRDGDGKIIQERTDTARLYQSWWGVITLKPNLDTHLKAVLTAFRHLFYHVLRSMVHYTEALEDGGCW